MNTPAAALALDFTDPAILAARKVRDVLNDAQSIDRQTLVVIMTQSYGSPSADGRWTMRDAYDALESGEVLDLIDEVLPSDPSAALSRLNALLASLPTHSVRSEDQIALQQFSTPAPIAYLASLALRLTAADLVLEPSAGTGLLAVFAHRAGARLLLNEIDPARADLLRDAFPETPVTHHVSILAMNGDSYRLKQSASRRRSLAAAEQNQATAEHVDPDTGEITAS
jgi:hypothetical protein